MDTLRYQSKHYRMFYETFGSRGLELAARLHPPVVGVSNKAQVDMQRAMIHHTREGFKNPLVVLHEFAHAYHAYHWPAETDACEEYRAEACAHIVEYVYAAGTPSAAPLLLQRMPSWDPRATSIVLSAVRPRTDDLKYESDEQTLVHDRMEDVLRGLYG